MVLRHLDALHAENRAKLERFSHEQGLMLFLGGGGEALEKVRGDEPFTTRAT
nr:23S rRNA (uracil(1939)-C(5))-methyltransferase RlmD [Candidatus Pantoea persica]